MPASVLLIEDEALIRMMLVEMIEEVGHSVVAEAGDVGNGAVLATNADFDLAILDINLGGDTIEPIASVIADRGFLRQRVWIVGSAEGDQGYSGGQEALLARRVAIRH
ncbi:response regulator [Bradyrhizobium sp. WYCCWR 12699]|uniref:response regulator n=1 Tax=Bradyrhizobium sp. WYCCWR 12699 TaxID=3064203 RepID=UPI0028A561A7|nr:response regulator [Bradyrhizobium sp. WYCCWR 12699]MDT4737063.1 response regulator [Bradyrhizobium sp. WYCCWR 12699]